MPIERKFREHLAEDQLPLSDGEQREVPRLVDGYGKPLSEISPERGEKKERKFREHLAEDQLPRSYILAEKTKIDKERDQFTYTYITGNENEPPEDWVGPSKKHWGERLSQHYQNNIAEGELNRLYYDRQKVLEEDGEWDNSEIETKETALLKGQVRARQLGGGIIDGVGQSVQDFLVGCGRMAYGAIDTDDYKRFYTGAQLRKHPDYTRGEAIIHGTIDKVGDAVLWLIPGNQVVKTTKLLKAHKLVHKTHQILKGAATWEAVLAGPELTHIAVDEALEEYRHYYHGTPKETNAEEAAERFVDAIVDSLWWAGAGGVVGMMGGRAAKINLRKGVSIPSDRALEYAPKVPVLGAIGSKEGEAKKLLSETGITAKSSASATEIATMRKKTEVIAKVAKTLDVELASTVKTLPEKVIGSTRLGKEAMAKFPTYSAFIERKFPTRLGTKLFYRDPQRGWERSRLYLENRLRQLREKLAKSGRTNKWFGDKVILQGVKMTRGEKLSIVMHQGQGESKFFIGGRERVFDRVGKLESGETEYISMCKDILKKQGQDLSRAVKILEGRKMKVVDNYYPIRRHKEWEPSFTLRQDGSVKIPDGFTKTRVPSKHPVEVSSIERAMKSSIAKTGDYIHMAQPVGDALKVLKLMKTLNKSEREVIEKGLKDAMSIWKPMSPLDKIIRKIHMNITVGILGANPWVAAKQVFSSPIALTFIKFKWYFEGLRAYHKHPKNIEFFARKYSTMIDQRLTGGFNKEMVELRINTSRLSDKLKERMMDGIKFMDKEAVLPIWHGAYEQARHEIMMGRVGPEVGAIIRDLERGKKISSHDGGVLFADSVVSRTQPMFNPLDRSHLSRSTAFVRSWTMFSSATNQMMSLLVRTKGRERAWAASTIGVNVLGVMAVDWARDEVFHREHPKTLTEGLTELAKSSSNLVYFVRDFANWLDFYRYGSHPDNPLVGWGADVLTAAHDALMGMLNGDYSKRQAERLVDLGLTALGIPIKPVKQNVKLIKSLIPKKADKKPLSKWTYPGEK